ncbi:hypothetical protein, partial [Noviherbaspirillum sp.]|uniref:hypothetical protein n=1 Tax=Noviherbaspirillum sp. TaxID=1926288 RepID=UPI002D2AC81C
SNISTHLSGNCHVKTPKKEKLRSQRSQLLLKFSQLLLRMVLSRVKNKCDGHHTHPFFDQKQHASERWCLYNARDSNPAMLS